MVLRLSDSIWVKGIGKQDVVWQNDFWGGKGISHTMRKRYSFLDVDDILMLMLQHVNITLESSEYVYVCVPSVVGCLGQGRGKALNRGRDNQYLLLCGINPLNNTNPSLFSSFSLSSSRLVSPAPSSCLFLLLILDLVSLFLIPLLISHSFSYMSYIHNPGTPLSPSLSY